MIDGYFLKFTLLAIGSDGKPLQTYVLASTIRGFRESEGFSKSTVVEREVPGIPASYACIHVRETLDECLAKLEQIPMMSSCIVDRMTAVYNEMLILESQLEDTLPGWDADQDLMTTFRNCRIHLEQCLSGCRVPLSFAVAKD